MSNYQKDSETHANILTDVCLNVCDFIKTITIDNMSKDEKISTFVTKIDDLQLLCSELNTKLNKINEHVKTLADSLHFTFNQDESVIDLLIRWNSSLLKKNVVYSKKRKLYSAYSPLKLSLKDKVDGTKNNLKSTKFEKENKVSSQNELKHVWKLETKRDGNPIDLLKKSKQTTLAFKLQEEKVKMDITTISSSTPKKSNLNLSGNFSPEVLSMKSNNVSKNIYESNSSHENQITDNCNTTCNSHISKEVILKSPSILNPKLIKTNVCENNLINTSQIDVDDTYVSLNHFNTFFKDGENVSTKNDMFKSNESNTTCLLTEKHDQSCNEIIFSPIKVSKYEIPSKIQKKILNTNLLDSFDIIPGLNDKQNDLPNYKFKSDPVRKQNERKLLNGWDCEDCCKFYEANNDNPVEVKKAMNHFSRHRSVKHQHHASTPPGFWDPI
ncbi:Hypothetical protein CINCED_3A022183 [Cinara cedri]|uniref:DNA endonuclease activator Ctp1 C-terminal domain-containing protein n=1 Tax=Cinara cedri TaxID=506608 RepID=A0A5E4NSA5_9HEMI|nr:Hypothetical protein CINCED_3A022183 [Cinara cedri]